MSLSDQAIQFRTAWDTEWEDEQDYAAGFGTEEFREFIRSSE